MIDTQKTHHIKPQLLERKVRVLLVGAGGNGSQMLSRLARLHQVMLALGHPEGLEVVTVDGDTVSQANVARQQFYLPDVGLPKAVVLTHRVNACFGLNWEAHVGYVAQDSKLGQFQIVIGCVDTRKARRAIHHATKNEVPYWLDLGNSQHNGQVCLGEPEPRYYPDDADKLTRLPTITEFYPDILDPAMDAKSEADSGPSCSLAEAVQKQSAFVNDAAVTHASAMLFNLFRYGTLDYSMIFFDTKTGRSSPLPVDPAAWSRFGITRTLSKVKRPRRAA